MAVGAARGCRVSYLQGCWVTLYGDDACEVCKLFGIFTEVGITSRAATSVFVRVDQRGQALRDARHPPRYGCHVQER